MNSELSRAEKIALEATELESFPVNLLEIRRSISLLLSEFGRYGFFDEYTLHSFVHIQEMLHSLDWLVPSDTDRMMSKGDWFFIVLACYFHDLGLLITKDEFQNRDQTKFRVFCDDVLFSGVHGADYKARIEELEVNDREKLLYQEFVRFHHAARVRGFH